jgi:hypothetical protein
LVDAAAGADGFCGADQHRWLGAEGGLPGHPQLEKGISVHPALLLRRQGVVRLRRVDQGQTSLPRHRARISRVARCRGAGCRIDRGSAVTIDVRQREILLRPAIGDVLRRQRADPRHRRLRGGRVYRARRRCPKMGRRLGRAGARRAAASDHQLGHAGGRAGRSGSARVVPKTSCPGWDLARPRRGDQALSGVLPAAVAHPLRPGGPDEGVGPGHGRDRCHRGGRLHPLYTSRHLLSRSSRGSSSRSRARVPGMPSRRPGSAHSFGRWRFTTMAA